MEEKTTTLFYSFVGDGTPIPIEVKLEQVLVGTLKKMIKYEAPKYVTCDSHKLKLHLAIKNKQWLSDDEVLAISVLSCAAQENQVINEENLMDPKKTLSYYFSESVIPAFEADKTHILVLVEHYPKSNQDEAVMPAIDHGWTGKWLSEFRMSQIAPHDLPLLGELEEFINKELPVKIALHTQVFDRWMGKMHTRLPGLMAKIFRVSNSEPCVDFLNLIAHRVVEPVDTGDTEISFISFWDSLIRQVLDFIRIGKSNRNSSTSTGSNRPNFVFLVNSVCVFRGEEKAPGELIELPRRELLEKLFWTYGDTPYLFGYAAVGYHVRLYAIIRAHNAVDAIELGVYDTRYLEGRFWLVLAVLNVSRLLHSIAKLCPESACEDYMVLSRDHGVKVNLEPSHVVKSFPQEQFERAKDHAEAVYKVLEEHAVPYVDHLDHADRNLRRLIFKPRGQERKPANMVELFRALTNVLEALVTLHAAMWMHRDIRWANVIKSRDDDNLWFLIDFMDAAQSPQASPSGHHLSKAEHAPEIFSNGTHTTAVDVWAVGRLIETCQLYGSWYDTGRERTQFVELLMHEDPSARPTANAALDQLRRLEQNYLSRI